jgi:phosphoglycerate kinase
VIPQIDSLQLAGKRTFIRVDFNVPLEPGGKISDLTRLEATLPTIRFAITQGAKVVLASHLGRPKGKVDPQYSLLPVAQALSELLEIEVIFPEDCVGDGVKKLIGDLKEGQVILLENLRFHPGEEANDPHFSEALAGLADVYINDAFGTLHRAHASTVGMVSLVAERAAGKLVKKEVDVLHHLLEDPRRPFWAILGGAKVSDKLGVLENLLKRVDGMIIGGAMAYTILKAKGVSVGASRVEEGKVRQAAKILERGALRDIPILLPVDHVVAQQIEMGTPFQTTPGADIPAGWMGLDIGPKSLENFSAALQKAGTVLWNGPLGVFEIAPFDRGTVGVAKTLSQLKAWTVVGGGDSLAAVKRAGVEDKIGHLSTGGGATLEYLEGKILPGLKALEV